MWLCALALASAVACLCKPDGLLAYWCSMSRYRNLRVNTIEQAGPRDTVTDKYTSEHKRRNIPQATRDGARAM